MLMYNTRENSTNVFTLVFLGLPVHLSFFTCFTKFVMLVMTVTIVTIKIGHVKNYMLKNSFYEGILSCTEI